MSRRPMSPWERAMEGFAKTRIGGWLAVHVANPIDRRLIPLTRGRFGLYLGAPVGVLETVGARSGQARRTPLLYLEEGDRIVLVASRAGGPRHPGWYHNLKADPRVRFLRRGGHEAEYVAREATGPERSELWAKVNDLYAGYETYQGRAGTRRIPVIVLEPAAQPGAGDSPRR
jgi:deazaflavin-dependent oxidoreductase (nitroreductase family)